LAAEFNLTKFFLDFAYGSFYVLQGHLRMTAAPFSHCLVDGMLGGPKRVQGRTHMTTISVLLADEDAYAQDTKEGENDEDATDQS
jgi:hypothetical protein